MKRASYREAVELLALNGDYDLTEVEQVAADMTTDLVATLFGLEAERVARDILKFRARYEAEKRKAD